MTSDAERQRISREKKRLAKQDAGMPWLGLVAEEREQAIRDFYGYAPSEKRTQAERQEVADRITGASRAKEQLAEAQKIWDKQGADATARSKAKFEDLRDALIERGVKNVPVSFEVDSEARARRAAGYAKWREQQALEDDGA